MKTSKLPFFVLLVLLISNFAQAQSSGIVYPSARQTIYEIYGYRCNILGTTSSDLVTVDPKISFSIIDEKIRENKKYYLIRVWDKKKPKKNGSTQKGQNYRAFQEKFTPDTLAQNKQSSDKGMIQEENELYNYILVEAALIEKNTIQLYHKRLEPVAGPLVIPVKLRSNPFDFSSDISFGAAVGVTARTSKKVDNNRWYFLASGGITALTIDSLTTKGEVLGDTDFPGFYLSAGAVLSLRNSFSVGLFLGVDYLSARNRNSWIYQGEPWIGLGIGISMFDLKRDDDATIKKVQ